MADAKPNSLAVLFPTRGRPQLFERSVKTAVETASRPDRLDINYYIDSDDPTLEQYSAVIDRLTPVLEAAGAAFQGGVGDRIGCPRSANYLALTSKADVIVMGNDDQQYVSAGWDERLDNEVAAYPDDIFLFWFNDGIESDHWCCFPIVSRAWVDTLGYFFPGNFEHFFVDTWLMDLGCRIGRAHYLRDVDVKHLPVWAGLSPSDTELSNEWFAAKMRCYIRDMEIYERTERYRELDAELLRGRMRPSVHEQADDHPTGEPRTTTNLERRDGPVFVHRAPKPDEREEIKAFLRKGGDG